MILITNYYTCDYLVPIRLHSIPVLHFTPINPTSLNEIIATIICRTGAAPYNGGGAGNSEWYLMPNAMTSQRDYHSLPSHPFIHATCSFLASLFAFQSFTAARIASSANIEQCNFTGGNFKCAAISVFLMERTSSTCLPLTHSVATDEEAMAEPQPKVLNFDSWMLPSLSTLIWSCKCVAKWNIQKR